MLGRKARLTTISLPCCTLSPLCSALTAVMLNVRHNVMRSENQAQDNRAAWLGGSTHLPGGGCSSVRSVSSMPFTFRSISSSLSTGRSALLPAQE